jgi:hypothetical protein
MELIRHCQVRCRSNADKSLAKYCAMLFRGFCTFCSYERACSSTAEQTFPNARGRSEAVRHLNGVGQLSRIRALRG